MNFKVLAGHMAQFKKMIKTRGLGFAIQSVFWQIKTGWQKVWIGIEDRLGWFSYARWI